MRVGGFRVLLVGGHGFIGSHLATELAMHGHQVMVLDPEPAPLVPPSEVDLGIADGRGGKVCRPIVGEAPGALLRAEAWEPEVVVHLAAAVGRVFGEDDRYRTISTNASLTASVAEWSRQIGARLVYVSTSEVYGDVGSRVASEDMVRDRWALPHNLYGLSKRWGEEAATLYTVGEARRDSDGALRSPAGLQIVRPSMPYGPGLPPGRGRAAIVNMLDQAYRGAEIVTHDGAERSWCWVGDAVRAFRLIVERGQVALAPEDVMAGWGCYNLGRDDAAVPMVYVARLACLIAGRSEAEAERLIRLVKAPPNQTTVKRLATSKIRGLGWQPEVELEDGMRATARWLGHVRA